jgi:hypothetical protein
MPSAAISKIAKANASAAAAKAKAKAAASKAMAKAPATAMPPVAALAPKAKARAAAAKAKAAAARVQLRLRPGKGQNDHNGADHAIFCFSQVKVGAPLSKEHALWCCLESIGMGGEKSRDKIRGVLVHEGIGEGDANEHYKFAALWDTHHSPRYIAKVLRESQKKCRDNEDRDCSVQALARFKTQLLMICRLCLRCHTLF